MTKYNKKIIIISIYVIKSGRENGSKTPQQPIKLGAKTDKVSVLWMIKKEKSAFVRKYEGFFV